MKALFFFIQKIFAYRTPLLIGILLSILLALSSIALLTLSGWFITAAAFAGISSITAVQFNYFIPAASIRFLALTRILSRYADRVLNHDTTLKILSGLRVWFYQQLLPLSPAYLLMHRSGDLLNGIVNDIDTLDHLYLNVISPFLIAMILILSTAVFVAHFSFLLSILLPCVILFSLTIVIMVSLQLGKKIGRAIQDATMQLRMRTIDCLQGFLDQLLFVSKEKRLNAIDDDHQQLIMAQKKLTFLKGMNHAAVQFSSGVCLLIVLFVGIPLVHQHRLTGAELTMLILFILIVFEQLLTFPLSCLTLGKSQRAATRLLTIANQKPAVIFPAHSTKLSSYHLQFNSVSFAYPNRNKNILNQFTLDIPEKMHIGITGPSGSGKTTIANLLTRMWDPSAGEITLGDVNLKNYSEHDLRKTICFSTQQIHIFNANVHDNLTLMRDDITDTQCDDVLEKMELLQHIQTLPKKLQTEMGEFGQYFSGGQCRRIALARALLQNTSILILDEPSTGLEDDLMERIWNNCRDLFSEKTILLLTHDKKLLRHMQMEKCIDDRLCFF